MYALVKSACPWLDDHIKSFLRHHERRVVFVDSAGDMPDSAATFQWCDGWELNENFAVVNRTRGLINAYPNSDALARKDHLVAVVDYWTARRPDSILRIHVSHAIRLSLDYSEYVDEALAAADDLTLLASLEENAGKDDRDREWWMLKPALVDCGAGIRLFSTVEELAGHLELAEYEDEDENEEESETEGKFIECEKAEDDSFTSSRSIPGIDSLDGLILATGPPQSRPRKPQYVFKAGGRIPSLQMRAFVAQRYISDIAPLEKRKWHVRP